MEVIYPAYLSLKGNLVFKHNHSEVGREGGGNREDKRRNFNDREKKKLRAQTNATSKLKSMSPW